MKNLNSSSWTGRAPRSLEGAFGPSVRSTHAEIMPMEEHFHASDVMVMKVSMFCAAVVVVIFAIEWWFA